MGCSEELFGYKEPLLRVRYTGGTLDVLLQFAHGGTVAEALPDLEVSPVSSE